MALCEKNETVYAWIRGYQKVIHLQQATERRKFPGSPFKTKQQTWSASCLYARASWSCFWELLQVLLSRVMVRGFSRQFFVYKISYEVAQICFWPIINHTFCSWFHLSLGFQAGTHSVGSTHCLKSVLSNNKTPILLEHCSVLGSQSDHSVFLLRTNLIIGSTGSSKCPLLSIPTADTIL